MFLSAILEKVILYFLNFSNSKLFNFTNLLVPIYRANKIQKTWVNCNIIVVIDTNMNANTPKSGSYKNIWPTIVSVPSKTQKSRGKKQEEL